MSVSEKSEQPGVEANCGVPALENLTSLLGDS